MPKKYQKGFVFRIKDIKSGVTIPASTNFIFSLLLTSLVVIVSICSVQVVYGETNTEPTPGSNENTNQICSVDPDLQPSSLETKRAVVAAAQRGLALFLSGIESGKEVKFGFADREEMDRAIVIDTPYQLYIRCQNEDFPTNRWRVPVSVSGQAHGFIGVEFREAAWHAVDFGGVELSRKVKELSNEVSSPNQLLEQGDIRRILIRDYQRRIDYLLLQTVSQDVQKDMVVLDYPEVIQEQNQWCWAGVSASLFDYFDSHVEQCEIAEYVREVATWHDFGSTDCCADPYQGCNYWNYNWGYPGSIEDILENMQSRVEIPNYGIGRSMSSVEVEADLDEDLPPIIRWGWDSGGGHFVMGFGIDDNPSNPSDPLLHYMDPWFGEGSHIALFSWVVRGGTHTWTHTNRLTDVLRLGDVNGSHHLELGDAITALQTISQRPTTALSLASDVNDDFRIGLAEALYLLEVLAEL